MYLKCNLQAEILNRFGEKKLGYPPFEAQTNPICASGLIFVHVQEKINILLSVSSNNFLMYFDICLNTVDEQSVDI